MAAGFQQDAFQNDAFETITSAWLPAFQANAFQNDAFQTEPYVFTGLLFGKPLPALRLITTTVTVRER
jgi:hypothetical protein